MLRQEIFAKTQSLLRIFQEEIVTRPLYQRDLLRGKKTCVLTSHLNNYSSFPPVQTSISVKTLTETAKKKARGTLIVIKLFQTSIGPKFRISHDRPLFFRGVRCLIFQNVLPTIDERGFVQIASNLEAVPPLDNLSVHKALHTKDCDKRIKNSKKSAAIPRK